MSTLPCHWPKGNRQNFPKKFLKLPAQTGGQKSAMIAGISLRALRIYQISINSRKKYVL